MLKNKRYLLNVYGIVQGVGFRPFVYNAAKKFNISGWVNNSGGAVVIDMEGNADDIKNFVFKIIKSPPERAVIKKVKCFSLKCCNYDDFKIVKSSQNSTLIRFIPPDIGVCDKCIEDIMNKKGKRYRYAFANCTQCGPRYSIIKSLPYDRKNTEMSQFIMCKDCMNEYENPSDRRFNSQANCCIKCGPSLTLLDNKGETIECSDEIKKTAEIIKSGKIVAIKGIGGFHLVCDAKNENAVLNLRKRKIRPDKPLAVMMKDIDTAEKYCFINEKEKDILKGSRKPIVLLYKKPDYNLPENIAPYSKRIGVMLPYTPLYYLLFEEEIDVLVMTSGNISGCPIEYKNENALKNLKNAADYFLMNDRDINVSIDDSVVKVFNDKECIIRLGRGYAPYTVESNSIDNIAALGSQEKSCVSFSQNGYIYTSQYLGNLESAGCFENYKYALNNMMNLLSIKTEVWAFDMHPLYNSLKILEGRKEKKIKVQHHHAHMVSCMLEYGIFNKVIGVIYDGTGYGTDKNIWGGEFLVGNRVSFYRAAHLKYARIQGADSSIKEPWKCAASYLFDLGFSPYNFIYGVDNQRINIVVQALKNSLNCYKSSSMGRLFDACAALIGLGNYASYEGENAVKLENIIDENVHECYEYDINKKNDGTFEIDYRFIIEGILNDLKRKIHPSVISAKFHNTISKFTCEMVFKLSKIYKINDAVLSGGVFENEYLLKCIVRELEKGGVKVFYNCKIPINDNGISFGQIASASAALKKEEKDNVSCSSRKN